MTLRGMQLDDRFRLDYAGLWHAIIMGDARGIERYSGAMNAGDTPQMFASVLTMRPWEHIVQQKVRTLSPSPSFSRPHSCVPFPVTSVTF